MGLDLYRYSHYGEHGRQPLRRVHVTKTAALECGRFCYLVFGSKVKSISFISESGPI